ncbi:tRNA (guanosine(18)-2'-O)-methyltransferase [Tetrabaena socialis]|uniref:tRNA (Guanosine(18)-2'-O)-methyltransferase n=1 Tax=Tetrabaena socialis TaxID=47790 RepID=A0A2J8AHW6_9CHLO|nr:tRNA (guanosine(18)-2'-O)-methyltransferase [Tetrabaena socialis]|eukprot:PNH12110.1 tRNA (guanosine(18)-2'-O)-methyltransferase [Tetrabaena socialis]
MLEERVQRINRVAAARTFTVLPVVEGLYDMGNLSAVCRSADALGYGAVHCVKKVDGKYKQSTRTAGGSDKWLDVKFWDTTGQCLAAMKAAGYQIITTHMSKGSISIQEVDWARPTAVILGNEKFGVSQEAVEAADACAIIPMTGMVESFNISVASSLILYEAQRQRQQRLGSHTDLPPEQQLILKAVMLSRAVKQSRTVLSELLNRPPPSWQAGTIKELERKSAQYEAAVAARSLWSASDSG